MFPGLNRYKFSQIPRIRESSRIRIPARDDSRKSTKTVPPLEFSSRPKLSRCKKTEREREREREMARWRRVRGEKRKIVIDRKGAYSANIIAIYKHSSRWRAAFSSPIFHRQLCICSPPCREIQGIACSNSPTSIIEREGRASERASKRERREEQRDEVIAARAPRTCV